MGLLRANRRWSPLYVSNADEVATILNVSVTTVTRQFATLEGVIDLGSPTSCHKRRKRILRIPRSTLERYIAERKVQVRRRKGQ